MNATRFHPVLPALLAFALFFLGAAAESRAVEASQSPTMAPLPVGQAVPAIELAGPMSANEAKELGLKAGAKTFKIQDLKAPGVILVVYSMYCPYCQREAPQLNALHKLIKDRGLSGKLKLLGVGAGNSPFEVNVFRTNFAITFPLIPDKDFSVYKSLGQVGTPYYYVLKRRGKDFIIVSGKLGQVDSVVAFLDEAVANTLPDQGK
jgi:peroxiredoxin